MQISLFLHCRSKSEWLRSLDAAIHHSQDALPYHAVLAAARKHEHAEEEARETAERIRRDSQADIIENTQAELMAEKMVIFLCSLTSCFPPTSFAKKHVVVV